MGLAYGGEMELGVSCPIVGDSIGPASADLSAQLAGAVKLQASLSVSPPTSASIIASLNLFIAQLTLAGSLGLPNVSFDLAACASLIASLQANVLLLTQLQALLAQAGVFAYVYTGGADALGAALTTEFASQYRDTTPSTTAGTFIILGAHAGVTEAALTTFFAGA